MRYQIDNGIDSTFRSKLLGGLLALSGLLVIAIPAIARFETPDPSTPQVLSSENDREQPGADDAASTPDAQTAGGNASQPASGAGQGGPAASSWGGAGQGGTAPTAPSGSGTAGSPVVGGRGGSSSPSSGSGGTTTTQPSAGGGGGSSPSQDPNECACETITDITQEPLPLPLQPLTEPVTDGTGALVP